AAGLERDRALDRVGEVLLSADDVGPRRRVRILEVGHVDAGARVERVDDHLAVDRRTGDLDAPILDVGRDRSDAPVRFPHGTCLREEVRELAREDSSLTLVARREQLLAPAAELTLELGDELERLWAEDASLVPSEDVDARGGRASAHDPSFAAWNCASSVEPLSARVELVPSVIASSTASK